MSKEFSCPYFPELKLESIYEMLGHFPEETRQFFIDCIETGAMNEVPRTLDEPEWDQNLYLLFRFALSEDPQRVIAQLAGLPLRELHNNLHQTVYQLWENLPYYLQKEYDPEALSLDKSDLEKTKKMLHQIEQWKEENLPPDEILQRLHLKNTDLDRHRHALRWNHGVEVDTLQYRSKFKNNKIADELRNGTDDEKIQRLLNMINKGAYNRFRRDHEKPVILSVRNCIPKELHVSGDAITEFIDTLLQSDIPVGKVEYQSPADEQARPQLYFFVAAQHKSRVEQFFLTQPNLEKFKRNPVEQLVGPRHEEPPTTTLLVNKVGYETLTHAFKKLENDVYYYVSAEFVNLLFDERCPVPIYRHRLGFYYALEKEPELIEYLKMRIEELSAHDQAQSNE